MHVELWRQDLLFLHGLKSQLRFVWVLIRTPRGPSSGGLPNHWADTHHDAPIRVPPGGAGKHCLLLPQRPSSRSVKENERMDGGDGIMKRYYGGVWTR